MKKKEKYTRRQDLPELYDINGAIYIIKTKLFLKSKSRWVGETLPYIMSKAKSVDIDDMFDWKVAEILLKEEIQ